MATGGDYETLPGLVAGGSLTGSQYKVVKIASTAGAVKVGSASSDKLLGILQNAPADGKAAEVAFLGVAKALAEASVAYGDRLTCSSTGRVKTTTTAGHVVVGHALNTVSTSAGDIIPVALTGIFNY